MINRKRFCIASGIWEIFIGLAVWDFSKPLAFVAFLVGGFLLFAGIFWEKD